MLSHTILKRLLQPTSISLSQVLGAPVLTTEISRQLRLRPKAETCAPLKRSNNSLKTPNRRENKWLRPNQAAPLSTSADGTHTHSHSPSDRVPEPLAVWARAKPAPFGWAAGPPSHADSTGAGTLHRAPRSPPRSLSGWGASALSQQQFSVDPGAPAAADCLPAPAGRERRGGTSLAAESQAPRWPGIHSRRSGMQTLPVL